MTFQTIQTLLSDSFLPHVPPVTLYRPQNHTLNRFCETVIVASIVLTMILTLIVATGACERKHIK